MVKEFYEKFWKGQLPEGRYCDIPEPVCPEFERIAKWLKKGRTLDFGCGEGHMVYLADLADGVDVSPTALTKAKEIYPNHSFYLPGLSPQKKYKNVIAADVFEHLLDIDEAMEFIDEHLEPDGRLIILTNEISFLKLALIGAFRIDEYFHPYSPHIRYFTKNNMKKVLNRHGFKMIYCGSRSKILGILSTGLFVVAEKEKDD